MAGLFYHLGVIPFCLLLPFLFLPNQTSPRDLMVVIISPFANHSFFHDAGLPRVCGCSFPGHIAKATQLLLEVFYATVLRPLLKVRCSLSTKQRNDCCLRCRGFYRYVVW